MDAKIKSFYGKLAASTFGGVLLKTANYTAVSGDNGKLISFSSTSPVSLTMPASAPASPWVIAVENTGAGVLTIDRDGLNIDGQATNLTLNRNQGVWLFSNGTAYYTERGGSSGGGVGLSKYTLAWVAQTSVTVTHNLGTDDVLCQVYGGIAAGWFGCLVGAFTDSGGNVIEALSLNNGPSSFTVPFGATQLQLGVNDGAFFDNVGSWTIAVNGTNHTVLSTAQPWQFTGGQNLAFVYGITGGIADGTAPTVIGSLTAGSIVTIAYVSGLISPGGSFGTVYDAGGISGNSGTGGTPPTVDPAFYASNGSASGPFLQVQPESLIVNDGNTLTITFGVPFTGKAVVIG